MNKYPKIETLFKRDKDFKITDEIRLPEFENIKRWLITEKIDGTNIRILYHRKTEENISYITYKGRKEKSQIPYYFCDYLNKKFLDEKMLAIFNDIFKEAKEVCLYGEGYGAKIQKGGGNYNEGNSFRLFDVWIDGWWLEWDSVVDIAKQLGIKTAPNFCVRSIGNAIRVLKNEPMSEVAEEETGEHIPIEGIVARAYPMMLFRNGIPIKWKLKVKDYK